MGISYVPSCFLLLKLHYLLQCKKYPEGGEECLIHSATASSCFVFFFPVCGKSLMIILFLICPPSVLFSSHQVLIFLFLLPLHH